ncbi:1281_t:CDS:2 [Rhizophagus irregularis]|nr:1281_t:CDS:2 [Rhizophagus irregularis]
MPLLVLNSDDLKLWKVCIRDDKLELQEINDDEHINVVISPPATPKTANQLNKFHVAVNKLHQSVSYQIEISSQDVIKEKKRNAFAGIDADDLKLWKVCIRDDELQELKSDDELLASRSDL